MTGQRLFGRCCARTGPAAQRDRGTRARAVALLREQDRHTRKREVTVTASELDERAAGARVGQRHFDLCQEFVRL